MKILHVLDHSIPLHSGYTFRTRSILNQQRQLGIETVHVTSPKQGSFNTPIETIDGLTFYRTPEPAGFTSHIPVWNQIALIKPMYLRILDAINEHKPDIIHAHSPALNGLAALKASKKTGIPFVYEIRAFWEDAAVDHGTCKENSLRYRLTKTLENYVVKHANAVTTICEGLRNDLIQRGFDEDKFTVIPNAVNLQHFQISPHKDLQLTEQLGLTNKDVLGFLGSFYGYEGLDQLLDAMPMMLKQNKNIRLLLVGGGPQESQLHQQVKQLGLEQHVLFTGRVPHKDIHRYYSLVDLLIYPRKSMRLTDLVTPLKPLEAMAQKKLVLASDVGGHKELITHGKNGFLFTADDPASLANTATELFEHKQTWEQVLENGRTFVEQVRNWNNSVSNYLPLYSSLVKS